MLKRAHITEKSSLLAEGNVYCFVVTDKATKSEIAKIIKRDYKVTPISVRIVRLPGKRIMRGNKVGSSVGIKKAYVKLKQGDKIEFV